MSDKLSPDVSPAEIKVKRLNRIPLFIVLVLAVSTMAAITFMIVQSGNRHRRNAADDKVAPYAVDEQTAKSLLAGKPEYGVIEMAKEEPPPPKPAPIKKGIKKPRPRPQIEKKPELTLEEKELARIRAAKLKRFEQALSSPVSVGRGLSNTLGTGTQNILSAATAHAANSVNSDIMDKMLKSRESMTAGLLGKNDDPNKQQHKADYYMQDQPATEYLLHTRNKQRSPLEIKTGTVIPATMLGGLNSDLPGMILAQVSQNVYDTATGDYLLIPQGSRLVGTYDNFITYGQDRALVKWSRIVYPDGSTLELEGMPGTDQSGYAGFEDQVDHHYFRIFGSAILMSIVTGAYDYSQQHTGIYGTGEYTAGDALSSAVARELSQASTMLLRKNLNIQPTIKIRPGYRFLVMVKKDIIFPQVWELPRTVGKH